MRKELIYYTHEDKQFSVDIESSQYRFQHLAIHNSLNRNAGDTLLPISVRRLFDYVLNENSWQCEQVWEEYTSKKVEAVNREVDAIVIGGGGFLIRDQQGGNTTNSGWLWNISKANLDKLSKPLILFAVGYNRFRGQADFDAHFADHFQRVVDKSGFVGIRNSGSIRKISEYLKSDEQKNKLHLQYCPTTVTWQTFPEYQKLANKFDSNLNRAPILALNFAYDRPSMRFGENEDGILKALARVIKKIEGLGWEIRLTAHKVIDRAIETYLDQARVSYKTYDLTEAPYDKILEHYTYCDLAIGMRGHGQMIPFGLRRPVISLISHNKMAYFLEDIGAPEWGVEIQDLEFEEKLFSIFELTSRNKRIETKEKIVAAQEAVWRQSNSNMNIIRDLLLQRKV